jgi:hypothetical protein
MQQVMRAGARITPESSIDECRLRFEGDLPHVPQKARRLSHPEHVVVAHSDALLELTDRTRDEAIRRSGARR